MFNHNFQIIKGDVTNFKEGKRIPHCAFELQLLPEKVPKRLFYKVDIIGGMSEDFFYIRYSYTEPEGIIMCRAHTIIRCLILTM